MTPYGDRVSQRLSAFLEDPRSLPSAKRFFENLDTQSGLHKPSATATKEAKDDSNATYLLNQDGEIARQVFPALVEMKGTFSRIGPYFNASNAQGDPRDVEKVLPRLRAQIQFKGLRSDDRLAEFYPAGAIRASRAAVKGFILTQQELKGQHKNVKDDDFTGFVRTITREDRYALVGTTHLLLPTLRERSNSIPQVTLDDLDSDEDDDDVTLSPSKLKAKRASQTHPDPASLTKLTLRDFPDPDGQYAKTGSSLDAEVEIPKILNGQGRLVPPHEYDIVNRETLAIVETTICGWEMKKVNKFVTHLRIESIQLLGNSINTTPSPSASASPSPTASPTPGQKRKLGVKNKSVKRVRTRASNSTASSSTAKSGGSEDVVEEDEKMQVVDKTNESDNFDNL